MPRQQLQFKHGWLARAAHTLDQTLCNAERHASPALRTMADTIRSARISAAEALDPRQPEAK